MPYNRYALWAEFLRLAEKFERRMDIEHVEDTPFEKRMVVRDEWWEIHTWFKDDDNVVLPNLKDILKRGAEYEAVCSVFSRIFEVNRCRRNYLLLRDWSNRRSWYVPYPIGKYR